MEEVRKKIRDRGREGRKEEFLSWQMGLKPDSTVPPESTTSVA